MIESISTEYYRLPLSGVGDAGHGELTVEELVVARVRADGLEGTGYAYTIGRGGRAIRALIEHDLKPLLLGREAALVEEHWDRLWRALRWVGRGGAVSFAIAALDIALWDLAGQRASEPLYRLIGGVARPIPAYGSGVDLPLPLDALLRQVEGFLARGFRGVKIKVGRSDPAEDLERVRAVRALVGPNVDLMVDANMSWSVERALELGRRFEELAVRWLEEPTDPDDVAAHARLAAELDLPIALGESLHSEWEFRRYLDARAVDVVQLDVVTVGGITPWLRVAKRADAAGLPITTHYADELSAHLLCAVARPLYLEKHAFALDPYLEEPQAVVNGSVRPTEQPGHGLRFSSRALEPYRAE